MQSLFGIVTTLLLACTDLVGQHTVFMAPFGESQAEEARYRNTVKRPERQHAFEADHVAFYDGWKRAMSNQGLFEIMDAGPLGREVVIAEKAMTGADVIIGTLTRVGVNHMHVKAREYNALHLVPQYPPSNAVSQPNTLYLYPSPAMDAEAQLLHATRTWRGSNFVLIADTIRSEKKLAERAAQQFRTIQEAGAAEPQVLYRYTPFDIPTTYSRERAALVVFTVSAIAETKSLIAEKLRAYQGTLVLVPLCYDCLPDVPGATVLEPAWRHKERHGLTTREEESRAHAREAAWYMNAIGSGPYTPEILANQRPTDDACSTGLPAWGYIRARYKEDGTLGHWINAAVCLATHSSLGTQYQVVELPEW
jgi:hypothetical protein